MKGRRGKGVRKTNENTPTPSNPGSDTENETLPPPTGPLPAPPTTGESETPDSSRRARRTWEGQLGTFASDRSPSPPVEGRLDSALENLDDQDDEGDDLEEEPVVVGENIPYTHHHATGHAAESFQPAQDATETAAEQAKREEYKAKGYDTSIFALPSNTEGPYSKLETKPDVFTGKPRIDNPRRKTFKEKKEEHERKVRAKEEGRPPSEASDKDWFLVEEARRMAMASQSPSQATESLANTTESLAGNDPRPGDRYITTNAGSDDPGSPSSIAGKQLSSPMRAFLVYN